MRQHHSRSRADIKDYTFALGQKRECRAWHFGRHGFAILLPEAGEALETELGNIEEGKWTPVMENDFKHCHHKVYVISTIALNDRYNATYDMLP